MPAHLKDQSVRKRANKATTRTVLDGTHDIEAPDLPAGIEWHELTKAWWAGLWESAMAPEYLDMDIHGLFRVAQLYNDFWTADNAKDRSWIQIRLEKADAEYGTNPLARKRLEWQIAETAKKQSGVRPKPVEVAAPPAGVDPRLRLA